MESQIKFSPLIIGAMRLGDWGVKMSTQELEKFIDQCLDLGLKDFDHADIYGHYTEEANFGRVISRRPDLKSKVQITTKCGIKLVTPNRPDYKISSYNSTYEHIMASAERSLTDLNMERIDLLLIHRPDYLMDPAEIAKAFEKLKTSGKVKYCGVSNFTTDQFELLQAHTTLTTNQIEASLLHFSPFEDGSITQCQRNGIQPTIWSPLGGGKLFTDSKDEQIKRIHSCAEVICQRHSCTLDQLMIAWLLKHPSGMVPVLGTSKISRIKSALEAIEINLSHEEWYELLEASRGHQVA